jgi:hypothetical protein
MILGKLFGKLSFSNKVRPSLHEKGGSGRENRTDSSNKSLNNIMTKSGKRLVPKLPHESISYESRKQSLATIVEENVDDVDDLAKKNSHFYSRSITLTNSQSASFASDDDDVSTNSRSSPPKDLSDLCNRLRGRNEDLDAVLTGFERIEEIVWTTLVLDEVEKTNSAIQFLSVDPSNVPPPDSRFPNSVLPVEALLRVMIVTKECEQTLKRSRRSLEVCKLVCQELKHSPRLTEGISQTVREFVSTALLNLADEESNSGTFDEEILSRLSSVIRFQLRMALNAMNHFSPIVLAKSSKTNETDMRDVPRLGTNIASLFHQALFMVCEGIQDDTPVHISLKYRSAKRFVHNILGCAKRIENVDEKRKRAWQSAQKWSSELTRLFPGEACELAWLADLPGLKAKLASEHHGSTNDLSLIETHRISLQDKRLQGSKDLRSSRALVTGVCGKNGHFPEVAFILDA